MPSQHWKLSLIIHPSCLPKSKGILNKEPKCLDSRKYQSKSILRINQSFEQRRIIIYQSE